MSVVGTVPWRIVAGRAWNLAMANCSEQKDLDNLDRHLEMKLRPIVRAARARSGYRPLPAVKGQTGKLHG